MGGHKPSLGGVRLPSLRNDGTAQVRYSILNNDVRIRFNVCHSPHVRNY